MTIHDSFKLSKFQRLYEFEKLRKETSLSIGKIAYFSTANEEDSDVLAWELFVDCCLGKIEHEILTPLSAFEKDLLSSVTETTIPNPQFCSAYHYYETYQFRTRFFISRFAYFYWAKNSQYWRELKNNDFIGFWLNDNIREHDVLCAGLEHSITEIELQSAKTNVFDPKEDASHITHTIAPLNLSARGDASNSTDPAGLIIEITIKLGGDFWEMRYKGETRYIKNFSGMQYITYLLQNKGKSFSASNLEQAVNPPEFHFDNAFEPLLMSPEQLKEHGIDTCDSTNPENIFDDKGRALLKAHCQKIIARIDELRIRGDHEGVDKLTAELEEIETHINKNKNHLGGSRTMPDETKREINRISKAISRAINKVSTNFHELGSHLDKEIKKGTYFSYEPDSKINWTILK
ncbi:MULTISPECIES: hypothetical protein [Methylobacter]